MFSRQKQRGQALLLVTLALLAMCGVLGLAVDLGWGYFAKKSAQASSDAGALAGAYQALRTNGPLGSYTCGGTVTCASDPGSACNLSGNLANACEYAEQAGFTSNQVRVSAGTGTPPTGQSISATYWVTVRTIQSVPQLFSAVLGNTTGLSSARSTAALVPQNVNGSLITLNRGGPNDPGPNVLLKGNGDITAPQGVYVADVNGVDTNGNTQINGPIVGISGMTNPSAGGTNTFQTQPDGVQFMDPFAGMGQPPLPTSSVPTFGVPNGNISSGVFQLTGNVLGAQVSGSLPSGNYVPVTCLGICRPQSSVTPDVNDSINLNQNVTFSGGTFGTYFFYNGLSISSGTTVEMGSGQYVVVGGHGSGQAFYDQGLLQDANGGTDAGQMIIVTGSSGAISGAFGSVSNNANSDLYPGLATQINSNLILYGMATTSSNPLGFAQTTLFKSSTSQTEADPSGLNPTACGNVCGASLDAFAGVVFWQDQANSTIEYTSSGNINSSCGGINSPCATTYTTFPNINFHAQGDADMAGVFYQPRGASLTSIGHGNSLDISGKLKIITGSVSSNGGGGLNLQLPPIPLKVLRVSLVE